MKFDGVKVSFKSREPFFSKEADGRKPNTVRKLDSGDVRKDVLDGWIREGEFGLIEIVCAQDSGQIEGFTRQITDVSVYEEWYIISWAQPKPVFDIMTGRKEVKERKR